ncbi:MAG: hypothetical protein ABJN26_14835 [Stappiaceae bacterium]
MLSALNLGGDIDDLAVIDMARRTVHPLLSAKTIIMSGKSPGMKTIPDRRVLSKNLSRLTRFPKRLGQRERTPRKQRNLFERGNGSR